MKRMRLAVLFGLVCGLAASAFVLTPAAGAAPPVDGICSFPITIDQIGNPTDRSHFPPSGPWTEGFFTGQVFLTITNATNQHSINVNASGPGFNTVDGGFLLSGVSIFFQRSTATGDVPAPGIYITHGPVLTTFTDHRITQFLGHGSVSGNLCDQIA